MSKSSPISSSSSSKSVEAELVIKSNTESGKEDKVDEVLNIVVDSDQDNEMEINVQKSKLRKER